MRQPIGRSNERLNLSQQRYRRGRRRIESHQQKIALTGMDSWGADTVNLPHRFLEGFSRLVPKVLIDVNQHVDDARGIAPLQAWLRRFVGGSLSLQALFQELPGAAQRSCAKASSTGVPTMWLV